MIKKIFKDIVYQSDIRPILTTVYLTETKQVATDAYSLLEVDVQALDSDTQIKHSQLLSGKEYVNVSIKTETLDEVVTNAREAYPDYKRLIPTQELLDNSKEYTTIKLTPLYLAQLAKAISNTYHKGHKKEKAINLYVPLNKNKPLILQRTDKLAIGLLMPQSN